MIVEMKKGATAEDIGAIIERAKKLGFETQINSGSERVVIAILGSNTGDVDTEAFEVFAGVEQVLRIQRPYKLASRDFKKTNTIVRVGNVEFGGKQIVLIAGPCSVEPDRKITLACARVAKENNSK